MFQKISVMKKITFLLAIVTTTTLAFAQSTVDKNQIGNNSTTGKYLTTRGIQLYYEIYGQGEPLLFIHGNGGSILNFSNQIPYFAEKYKVIAVDSRAQGKSTDDSDSLSYEIMADDLNALLDSLKTGPCFIIGWSDGGINALLLALRHPDKVKKMAITGANLWPDTTAVDPEFSKIFEAEIAGLPPNTLSKNQLKLNRLLFEEPHITTTQLAKIQCPTLVMGGDHDVIRTDHTMLIANSIPQSYLWILPNSGHSTPIYYKDIFNMVVQDFLTKPYRKIEGMRRLE